MNGLVLIGHSIEKETSAGTGKLERAMTVKRKRPDE